MGANQHRLGRIGRAGAQEIVAAVGELVPVDLAGHESPVAIADGGIGGGRVVGGHGVAEYSATWFGPPG